jgi:hypothetical protein
MHIVKFNMEIPIIANPILPVVGVRRNPLAAGGARVRVRNLPLFYQF